MTFLMGDKVRTTENYNGILLNIKEVHIITRCSINGMYSVDGDNLITYPANRFELVQAYGFREDSSAYERGYQQGWHDALVWAGI